MREVVRAAETPLVLALDPFRCEPVGPLPAVAGAEHGAHAVELVIDRRGLGGTGIAALFVRIVDREDFAVGLLVLGYRIALAGVAAEATRIGCQHVDARLAFDDPFGQLPAGAAGGRDAEGVAFIEPHIALKARRADQRRAVRRVGNGTVDDVLDAAVLKRRDPLDRCLDVRQETVEIPLEEALAEPVRHPVGKARGCAMLVGTEDPAHALLAQIVGLVGLAQHRQFPSAL